MAMTKKILGATKKMAKKAGTFLDATRPETFWTRPRAGGKIPGVDGEFFPRIAKAPAAAAVIGGLMAVQVGDDMLKGRNKNKVGRVSYADGPARMTNSFTSGAVPAMIQGSGGDYEVFEDMAEETLQPVNVFGRVLDDYGANGEMIRSLYNMG